MSSIERNRSHGESIQPLSTVDRHQGVQIYALEVDGRTARRLADMGLTIGARATVVQTSPAAVVVAARGGRLAIGATLASQVFVAVVADAEGG